MRQIMSTGRMEAFSDGVIAIIITIMVLEIKAPSAGDFTALRPLMPLFLSYGLSFVYVGIYWNNHHHMLHASESVNGSILWANLHLLFWLSLFPVATAWVGENPDATAPAAAYGVILLLAAVAYFILQGCIIAAQGETSLLRRAVGRDLKGKASPLLYVAGIAAAFAAPRAAQAVYLGVALWWLVPDRRIEKTLG